MSAGEEQSRQGDHIWAPMQMGNGKVSGTCHTLMGMGVLRPAMGSQCPGSPVLAQGSDRASGMDVWPPHHGSNNGSEFKGPIPTERSPAPPCPSLPSVSSPPRRPPPPRHGYTLETCWCSLAWRSPYSHLMTRALRSMMEMP